MLRILLYIHSLYPEAFTDDSKIITHSAKQAVKLHRRIQHYMNKDSFKRMNKTRAYRLARALSASDLCITDQAAVKCLKLFR